IIGNARVATLYIGSLRSLRNSNFVSVATSLRTLRRGGAAVTAVLTVAEVMLLPLLLWASRAQRRSGSRHGRYGRSLWRGRPPRARRPSPRARSGTGRRTGAP